MTIYEVSISQQMDDAWRAEAIADYWERKKQKGENKANEHKTNEHKASTQSVESRLAYLEEEVRKLNEKLQSVAATPAG